MTLDLPLPPSTNGLFINVPGLGRRTAPAYTRWQWSALVAIKSQTRNRVIGKYKVSVRVPEKARADVDNYSKPLLDALVKNKVTDDDKHCMSLTIERDAAVEAGRCIVEIQAWGVA